MPRRYYSSTAVRTTLSGAINSSVTSITVASTSGFPGSFPYTLIIDQDQVTEEIVTVTAASGTILTVTRGADGTSAVAHDAGAAVNHGVSARDFDEPNAHVNDTTTDVHPQYVRNSLVQNTKGAVPVGTGSAVAALSPGSNGQTLVADSSQTNGLRYIDAQTQKNALTNGNFSVWQRGTTTSASGSQFIADRWNHYRGGYAAGITASRQTTSDTTNLPNIQYCLRVQRDSGNTSTASLAAGQNLESVDSQRFKGQTVTLSFWARRGANYSASGNILSAYVQTGTGTDEAGRNGLTGGASPIGVNFALTTTWQRFSASATLSSSLNQVAVLFEFIPVGTAGAADFFEVTAVQLETGPVATPFEFEPYEATLRKCQRYYQRFADGGAYQTFAIGFAKTTGAWQGATRLSPPMRATPTAIDYANIGVYDGTTVFSSPTSVNILAGESGPHTVATDFVKSGLTANRPYTLVGNNNAAAYVAFNAEL